MTNYNEWCPTCKSPYIAVTRGIPSMGICKNGHKTDRRDALRREPAVIEAPAQEPVAWRWRICYRKEWCWSIIKPMCSTHDLEQGTVFDVQPLYTTPAAAEAHLTALLRAEYERGVRAVASAIAKRREDYDREHGSYDYTTGVTEYPGTGSEYMEDLDTLEAMALALLTQEGR